MTVRQWTTPTKRLRVKGMDLTRLRVWVTFSQGYRFEPLTVEPDGMELDGEDTLVFVALTQLQTAQLDPNTPLDIQVNWMDPMGNRGASPKIREPVDENTLRRELSYDE